MSCHPLSNMSNAAFSPDGKYLAVKNTSGRIVVINSFTGEVLCDHKNQKEGEGCQVLFSPDGEMLIDGSWEGVITIRKAFEPKIVSREKFLVDKREQIEQISHDLSRRKWLIMQNSTLSHGRKCFDPDYMILRDWPFQEGVYQRYLLEGNFSVASLSPDGSKICSITKLDSGQANKLLIIRTVDGETIASIQYKRFMDEIVWSVDCETIGIVQRGGGESKFIFYRSSDLSVLGEVPCQYPSSICFLPNADQVVLGSCQFSRLARLEDFLSCLVKMLKSLLSG